MRTLISITVFMAVMLSGCTHYYYVPNIQNVPLFREKNNTHFIGALGGGDESNCIEIQVAHSITNHIGIMANFMNASGGNSSNKNSSSENTAHGNYFEGAIGYFLPVDKHGSFEIYSGLGGGSEHHQYASFYNSQPGGTADLTLFKFFVQPSFGLTSNFIDIAFSTRLYSLNFSNVEDQIYDNNSTRSDINLILNRTHFFIEPAATIRVGWKAVKVQFQLSKAEYLNNRNSNFYEVYHASLGLTITFVGTKEKKSQILKNISLSK